MTCVFSYYGANIFVYRRKQIQLKDKARSHMTNIIHEWLAEESKPIGKKLISARISLTTNYKIEVLLKDFDKTQTEIIQAALDIGLSELIDEWRGMNAKGNPIMPIDEEIEIMKEAGEFYKGDDDA